MLTAIKTHRLSSLNHRTLCTILLSGIREHREQLTTQNTQGRGTSSQGVRSREERGRTQGKVVIRKAGEVAESMEEAETCYVL